MSYLMRPRGHFYAKITINMPTGNNATSDYRGRPYFDAANASLDLLGGSPAQFREWFHQLNPSGYVNGGWNYYGDNSIHFNDVVMTSVELPDQDILTRSDQDSSIGMQVRLRGNPYASGRTGAILVDMDPNDGFTTQMIGHEFSLARDQTQIMTAVSQVKAYSRWLNLWRNLELSGDRGGAAVWQMAFPGESLTFQDVSESPFLMHLRDASQQGLGICVRLCTSLFQHRSYREIATRYREGGRGSLPGALLVMGTIGVWHPDEPQTMPVARLLIPDLAQPLSIPPEVRTQRRGQTFYPGAALALVDTARRIITVDLVNTLPEAQGFDAMDEPPDALPEKINLGTLSLQVRARGSATCECIGALAFEDAFGEPSYQQAASMLRGGIVEIPYSPEMEQAILEGDLVLLRGTESNAPAVLTENPTHILIDQRGLYLEVEDAVPVDVPIQVLVRGKPAPAGLTLTVEHTVNNSSVPRDAGDDPDNAVVHAAALDVVAFSPVVVTDAEGKAVLRVQPTRAGMGKVWVITPSDPDWTQAEDHIRRLLRAEFGFFLNVRVLPDDRLYDAIPDEDLTWDLLYAEVFRYYSLLYPIMNAYINFEDEASTRAAAARIVSFIAPTLKDSTLYMPITRDLSAGKRRLMERWAARVQKEP